MTIYLRHRHRRARYRIACDEDTKYYLFDDSMEPVGLTAERRDDWERITEAEYLSRPLGAYTEFDEESIDVLEQYYNRVLIEHGRSVLEP